MPESFELFRYLDHLRRRWRVIAVACGVAGGVALTGALLTTRQYTATARLMIEPPAGSDSRGALAVSPIYLESLKSYELLASGDKLFADALEHFKMPRSMPMDQMKRSVLKITMPRNTRVLEISITLHDPVQAKALALYIAEQSVKLARDMYLGTERELEKDAQQQLTEARDRMQRAENAWAHLASGPATQAPEHAAEVDMAQAQRYAARLAFESAEKRLEEVRSASGYRGERLTVIDPGVVPERPSWPKIPLMVLAALVIALAGSLLYLTFEFNYWLERSAPRSVAPFARVKARND
ncbi:MAG: lipopolysaccharide biosynthesis [Bryobacterales bacterium]|nr:lipopolysaccharide biosynthesis [Bryobacterales bacterium]